MPLSNLLVVVLALGVLVFVGWQVQRGAARRPGRGATRWYDRRDEPVSFWLVCGSEAAWALWLLYWAFTGHIRWGRG